MKWFIEHAFEITALRFDGLNPQQLPIGYTQPRSW